MHVGREGFWHSRSALFTAASVWMLASVSLLQAQETAVDFTDSYNLYGTIGLIDLPTASSADDAELAATIGHFAGTTRTTLSFQITPRLSGSFRYSHIKNAPEIGGIGLYDRSFDLRYRLMDEGPVRPSVMIGLQDIVGTGVYAAEYIVSSKHLTPALMVTGGIGWGRLGSYNGFDNPLRALDDRFATRPGGTTGRGGQFETSKWFRGDAALFGGLSWQATDDLNIKAEYSSDAYARERSPQNDLFERNSPLNFGLSYALSENTALQAHYLYGAEFGAGLTFTLNPRKPVIIGGSGQRPTPVVPRQRQTGNAVAWTAQPDGQDILRDSMIRLLEFEGMSLEAMALSPTSVTVLVRNKTYMAGAEAIGRTARILTRVMPASVEHFTIVPVVGGIRTVAVDLQRSDIEELEFAPDNAWKSFARAKLRDAAATDANTVLNPDLYQRLLWRIGPYFAATYFDPDSPIRGAVGLELAARYDIAPGVSISGNLQKRFFGNIGDGRESDSVIQRVRTDGPLYAAEGDPALTQLVANYQFNVSPDYYARFTGGYLEAMYGGLSAEVLWKPVQSRLGIGAEINYAHQRDFDQLFGFQDYNVITGHASAYYAFANNFHGQIDVGRYLAGDFGTTVSLDREFENGWRVGAFATLTDVSFDEFGEGSFDKGLRFSIPLEHFFGRPSRDTNQFTLRPLTRDGGARLNVPNRLYETIRENHANDLRGSWGRFWR